MLLISQIGTLIGFLVMAFSSSLAMMFISRIIDGIFGGNYPIAKAIVGDVVPPQQRGEQMSNIGVAHVLSSLVGPGLGGVLSPWGILAPGLMAATFTLVAIGMTWFFLEESHPLMVVRPQRVTTAQPPRQRPNAADTEASLSERRRKV